MKIFQMTQNLPWESTIVFQDIPKGLPPYRDHEQQIELIPKSTANKSPHRYPHQRKGEIEKMV